MFYILIHYIVNAALLLILVRCLFEILYIYDLDKSVTGLYVRGVIAYAIYFTIFILSESYLF